MTHTTDPRARARTLQAQYRVRPLRSAACDGLVVLAGLAVMAAVIPGAVRAGRFEPWLLVAVPLVALMARHPLVLLRQEGDIEIGFDSAVLVVLALVAPFDLALSLWALGMVLAQLAARKKLAHRLFNIGLGTSVGWLAVVVMRAIAPLGTTNPRELLAVAVGCAAYFVADFVVTDASLSLESGARPFTAWADASVPLSFAVFVGIDTLGYVGAVLERLMPWVLGLLAAPVVTLLLATRAFARANKNQVMMTGLFDAARAAQDATTREEVLQQLVQQVRRALRSPDAGLRSTPPTADEVGVVLGEVGDGQWLVAPRRVAGMAYGKDDRRTLAALAALAAESLQRARLVGEMAHLARHDPLTGLPNRMLFQQRVEHAVALRQRDVRPLAVLFVDLDGFKAVNDSMGHECGDQLLAAVAGRLRGCVRPEDTVARLGGDEFAVLLEEMSDLAAATEVSDRLLATLRTPFQIAGADLLIGASVGIAVRAAEEDADALLRNSDLAMYRAKELGKNRYEVFEPAMLVENQERLSFEGDLRQVIELDQLRLLYQPVVDLVSGHVAGFEALLRWEHPVHGTVSPLRFVGIAEDTGLITQIGEWVLERAYTDAARWADELGRPVSIGVNVSGRQLKGNGLVEQVRRLRAQRPADVKLVLEITESVLVRDDGESIETLRAVRDLGASLAIDDFGTGYSSISYLRHMPVDILKVDRSFVREITHDTRSTALVEAIAAMAESLGLSLVAEGIEEVQQVAALRALGCRLGQGYWFARPIPAAEADRYLRMGPVDVANEVATLRAPAGAVASRRRAAPDD